MWQQSYNSYYIQTYDNGAGWHEDITWKEARNNGHGVDSGAANNTFTCDGQEAPGSLCGQADDENWSRIVVLSRSSVTNNVTSTWSYQYYLNGLSAKPCSNCDYGYTWGNQNDNDYADYYNGQFTSFASAQVTQPDNSSSIDYFASTIGWGLAASTITCFLPSGSCNVAPYWNQDPGMAGSLKGEQDFNASGQLMQVKNLTYAMNCPPTGVAHSNNASGPPYNPGDTELISELDQNNPVVVCDPRVTQEDDSLVDGVTDLNGFQSDARVLHTTITTTYDGNNQGVSAYDYGNVSQVDTTANDVAGAHFVTQTSYYPNDNLGGGIYLTDLPAFSATLDGSGTYSTCAAAIYGANSSAPQAPSTTDVAQALGYLHPSGGCAPPNVSTAYTYDSSGNPLAMTDADGHQGCTLGSSQYSACVGYDSLDTHVTSGTNAANQVVSYQYDTSNAASGFGEWLLSTTDVNGNATTSTYDALGRVTSITKPGDATSTPTLTFTYNNTCSAGATTPCLEIDTTSLLTFGESQTTTTKQWYDGLGRLVETQTPGPNTMAGNPSTIVTYTLYDSMGRATTTSLPYAVTATGYVAPDLTQARTVTAYDSLGRPLGSVTYSDASAIVTSSTITHTVAQGVPGFTGESSTPFEQTVTLDSYHHEQIAFADALGRQRYTQVESGTGNPYTVVRTLQYTYDTPGDLTATTTYDSLSHQVAFHNATYDGLGQVMGWNDADSGACSNTPLPPSCSSSTDTAWKVTYDQNGNVLSETDPRGQSTYTSYDALNRPLCTGSSSAVVNPCSSNASSMYFYDAYGNSDNPTVEPPPCAGPPQQFASDPVGEKTSEIFSSAAGSGWRCFGYTDRGETDMSTLSITADSQTTTQTVYADYTELGQVADLIYPDGELVSSNFDGNGYFQGMSDANGAIASNVQYTNAGQLAGMTIGGVVYQGAATTPVQVSSGYDAIQRPASTSASVNGNTLFSQTRTYDNVGNVIDLNTTVPTTSGGSQTDNQAFCYDALDRLVWAGNSGTPTGGDHCGTAPSGSTTTSYQQSFSYDALDRFTTGPAGTTTYTDASHPHAATNVSSVPNQYASYDAMGNMTCRNVDTTSAHSCDSTQTGATMSYDNQARLASWMAPSGTAANEQFLYDNEGNRVLQRTVSTTGSTTTVNDTITFSGYTQTSITNSTTTTTIKYYSAAGHTVAMTDGSHWYPLLGDGLGSTTLALKSDGTVQAVQLYAPFGSVRSTDGTMPTPRTYTGHLLDDASGLLYYNARYYDPLSGNFTSADAAQQNAQGMNPYLYVAGNPETLSDPSGQRACTANFSECQPGATSQGNTNSATWSLAESIGQALSGSHAGQPSNSSSGYDPFSCGSYPACFLLGTHVETSQSVQVPALPVPPTEGSGIYCTGFYGITFGLPPIPQTGINVITKSSVSSVPMCIFNLVISGSGKASSLNRLYT